MKSSTLYLVAYNFAQVLGWGWILSTMTMHYVAGGDFATLWPKVSLALIYFQCGAALEVVHPLIGLVRTPVATALMQVFSRVNLVFICVEFVAARQSPFFTLMLVAWSVTEVIRYTFYALELLEMQIYLITWMRYTLFYVLYPTGVTGELVSLYLALRFAYERVAAGNAFAVFESLNPYTLCFVIAEVVFAVLYLPGFPKLYFYMIGQRRIKIGGQAPPAKKTKGSADQRAATSPQRKTKKAKKVD
jgi:very-long-chain (3R)-3-hydroxyacyl-CoA dehydratase